MDKLSKEEIDNLINEESDLVVSMYMPMEKAGRDVKGNSIQLKNQLTAAREQLETAGLPKAEIDDLLNEVIVLLNDREFLQHQDEGLAVFVTDEQTRIWRLPLSFEPLTTVGSHPHVKPLLDYLSVDGRFFTLALSQNQVRFFRGTRLTMQEITVAEMPTSLAEALRYDDPEARLQHYALPSSEGRQGADAIFHGHGDVESEDDKELLRFFQQIDAALRPLLAQENAPLLIASVDYLYPIYEAANSYQHLLSEQISGNPERWSAEELHEKALEILRPFFDERRREAWAHYQQRQAAAGEVARGVEEVAQAAYQGRVQTAFALNQQRWGQVNRETGQIQVEEEPSFENVDLLDFALTETLKNGGRAYLIDDDDDEIELEQPIVASLRF